MLKVKVDTGNKSKVLEDFNILLKEKNVSSPQSYLRALSQEEGHQPSNRNSPEKSPNKSALNPQPVIFDQPEPAKTKGTCEGCSIF